MGEELPMNHILLLRRGAFFVFFLLSSVYAREVLSWVPPYSISACYSTLTANFGAFSPKNVMTGVAMQFWRPTNTGGIVYEAGVTDTDVIKFRTKCNEYGIKLLLCVYNNNQQNLGWDWPLASTVFTKYRSALVNALYNECKRLKLDGVDIDFEGTKGYDVDRPAFAAFIKELGTKLRAEGLWLTVDSFHSPCFNAPNMAWWKDWAGYVNYIHSMGYAQLYEKNETSIGSSCPSDSSQKNQKTYKYSYQSQYGLGSGLAKDVVSIGMPSSTSWGGGTVREHVQEILNLQSPTSICIWDFTLKGAQWRESETWQLVKKLVDLDSGQADLSGNNTCTAGKTISISVTPNNVFIDIQNDGLYTVSLYDASGVLYHRLPSSRFTGGKHSLSLKDKRLVKGFYLLEIQGNKQVFAHKLVIN